MPAKTVSWRQRSEPPYRRPTTSPQMPPKSPIPPRPKTKNPMQSLSLTARVPSLSTAQTAKCQHLTMRKVFPANTPRSRRPMRLSSVSIPIVPLRPTESLHTKKTTTVTRRRRAKRTTWSPQLAALVILSPTPNPEETTVPRSQRALDHPRPAPPKPVTWTVRTTTVRQLNLKPVWRRRRREKM